MPSPSAQTGGGVEEATSKAIKMISALSDAAISGGKLSTELMRCSSHGGSAKFQPYSKHDYLCRLASFSAMSWFDKPVTSELPQQRTIACIAGASRRRPQRHAGVAERRLFHLQCPDVPPAPDGGGRLLCVRASGHNPLLALRHCAAAEPSDVCAHARILHLDLLVTLTRPRVRAPSFCSDAVSGAECARHGWRNDGNDRLRCDSCKVC